MLGSNLSFVFTYKLSELEINVLFLDSAAKGNTDVNRGTPDDN